MWRLIKDVFRCSLFTTIIELNYSLFRFVVNLYLLGNIPVPYSGLMAPDGHSPDHVGAWPADVFYADFDGEWADESINSSGASRVENKNIPGDGKFDKSQNDADIKYPVGRIDFYNLTSF